MNEAVEKEPTMEEILASIRRIISEDAEEDAAAPEPADDAPETSEEAGSEEDVLELTERAEDEGDSSEPEQKVARDEPPSEPEPEPEPDPMPAPRAEPEEDDGAEGAGEDALVSEMAEQAASASFAELSAMLVQGYEGSGNTLEGLVREMLKPMLKAWLDENLPRIVEDMVEREIARITARGGGR